MPGVRVPPESRTASGESILVPIPSTDPPAAVPLSPTLSSSTHSAVFFGPPHGPGRHVVISSQPRYARAPQVFRPSPSKNPRAGWPRGSKLSPWRGSNPPPRAPERLGIPHAGSNGRGASRPGGNSQALPTGRGTTSTTPPPGSLGPKRRVQDLQDAALPTQKTPARARRHRPVHAPMALAEPRTLQRQLGHAPPCTPDRHRKRGPRQAQNKPDEALTPPLSPFSSTDRAGTPPYDAEPLRAACSFSY